MTDASPHRPRHGGPPPDIPERIGPYRILEVVGEGGMGVVYSAEQSAPVRRNVAVKMMREGLDSREVVARFEAERHALSVMDHPGIARVLDAGVTEAGRPYFVMELVRGLRVDHYCDRFRLTARERVELFVQLCDAVQHAHQKGVIHRDLKPSNILVAEQDGRPTPKVIDFGIAKATGIGLSDSPALTTAGQALGTLAYMSPEQAESGELDVDTRADVYSLGIILYELLAGSVPMDPREKGIPQFLAQLVSRDTSFPLPRDRFEAGTEAGRRRAQSRGTNEAELRKALSGDIQWIVMKAIEKDRNRRYETVNGLRLDLVRFMEDRPIEARAPTAAYRLAKLARRHRPAVIAAAVAVLIFIAGSVATAVGFVRARAAEGEALAAREQALIEAAAAEEVADFLVDLFEVSDPGEARGSSVTAREILDRGARRVEQELGDQPVVQARMLGAIGAVYRKLGLLDDATALLGRSVRLYEDNLGANDVTVAEALYELGLVQRQRGDLEAAEQSLVRAKGIQEAVAGPESDQAGHILLALGGTLLSRGRLDEAEPLLQRALEIEERDLGSDHPELATVLSDLGALALFRSEFLRAEQYFARAIRLRERQLGEDHPSLASGLNNLGAAYYYQERYAEALESYERAAAIWTATLEQEHPRIANANNNIAEVHWRLGDYESAERLFLEALALKERILSPDNQSIATTLLGLANVYRDQGRHREAEPRYLRAIQIVEAAVGPDHARLREPLEAYAKMLSEAGRSAEAAAVTDRVAGLAGS